MGSVSSTTPRSRSAVRSLRTFPDRVTVLSSSIGLAICAAVSGLVSLEGAWALAARGDNKRVTTKSATENRMHCHNRTLHPLRLESTIEKLLTDEGGEKPGWLGTLLPWRSNSSRRRTREYRRQSAI